jgi:hypothetical protein
MSLRSVRPRRYDFCEHGEFLCVQWFDKLTTGRSSAVLAVSEEIAAAQASRKRVKGSIPARASYFPVG